MDTMDVQMVLVVVLGRRVLLEGLGVGLVEADRAGVRRVGLLL